MKIAVVVSTFPSVSETFIVNQIVGLLDRGHQVHLFAAKKGSSSCIHPEIREANLLQKTRYFPVIPKNKFLCRIAALRRLLQSWFCAPLQTSRLLFCFLRTGSFSYSLFFAALMVLPGNFDVIHVHFGQNALVWAQLKAMGLRFCLVTSFHGHDVNSYPRMYGNSIYKILFEWGDLFTVNTNFTRNQVEKLGCTPGKIRRLPVGLQVEQFDLQERVFPEDGCIRLLTVGRLVEKKGHLYMLRALPEILKRHPKIRYWIVGDGPLEMQLREEVNRLALEEHVEFLGSMPADQVRRIYTEAHVFILPSITAADGDMEGQGLVLQEAQATGLPVISTLHNGIPEGILDGKSGFLVPEKDSELLAEKTIYTLSHPEIWLEMGRAGRTFVEANYDMTLLNQQLEQIYLEACREYAAG